MPKLTVKVRRIKGKPIVNSVSSGTKKQIVLDPAIDEFEIGLDDLSDVIRSCNMEIIPEKRIQPNLDFLKIKKVVEPE